MTIVRCSIGEILMATIRGYENMWLIDAEHAACWPVIQNNVYHSYKEAEDCVRHMLPVPCREYIRFMLISGKKPN